MNNQTVCIIPARGGSKRIPGKNVKMLGGKPLIQYTIEAALESNSFATVVVSSDDDDILKVAANCGAQVDQRPTRLGGDTIKAVEVVVEYLGRTANTGKWKHVAMCLPTCPFREKEDVKKAMAKFHSNLTECPRLIGVTQCDFPPQLALTLREEGKTVDMREPEAYGFSTRSQDCQQLYFPNGSIYVSTVQAFVEVGTFFGRPMLYYEMSPERSFDIDYPYQFDIAECLMVRKKKKNDENNGE